VFVVSYEFPVTELSGVRNIGRSGMKSGKGGSNLLYLGSRTGLHAVQKY